MHESRQHRRPVGSGANVNFAANPAAATAASTAAATAAAAASAAASAVADNLLLTHEPSASSSAVAGRNPNVGSGISSGSGVGNSSSSSSNNNIQANNSISVSVSNSNAMKKVFFKESVEDAKRPGQDENTVKVNQVNGGGGDGNWTAAAMIDTPPMLRKLGENPAAAAATAATAAADAALSAMDTNKRWELAVPIVTSADDIANIEVLPCVLSFYGRIHYNHAVRQFSHACCVAGVK